MSNKIELGVLLRATDDAAWAEIERAMAADATVADVARAAVAVRVAGGLRRRFGGRNAEHIEREYLIGLSLRLMEIDSGDDLATSEAAAILISGGLKTLR